MVTSPAWRTRTIAGPLSSAATKPPRRSGTSTTPARRVVRGSVGDRDAPTTSPSEAFTRLLASGSRVHDPRATSTSPPTTWSGTAGAGSSATGGCRRGSRRPPPRPHRPATHGCATWSSGCPDRLRAPVLLHYYADMSVAEVAAALHKPEGTVKRMLHDARARLAEWMGDDR